MSKTQLGILNYLTQLGIPTIQTQSEEEADGEPEEETDGEPPPLADMDDDSSEEDDSGDSSWTDNAWSEPYCFFYFM